MPFSAATGALLGPDSAAAAKAVSGKKEKASKTIQRMG